MMLLFARPAPALGRLNRSKLQSADKQKIQIQQWPPSPLFKLVAKALLGQSVYNRGVHGQLQPVKRTLHGTTPCTGTVFTYAILS